MQGQIKIAVHVKSEESRTNGDDCGKSLSTAASPVPAGLIPRWQEERRVRLTGDAAHGRRADFLSLPADRPAVNAPYQTGYVRGRNGPLVQSEPHDCPVTQCRGREKVTLVAVLRRGGRVCPNLWKRTSRSRTAPTISRTSATVIANQRHCWSGEHFFWRPASVRTLAWVVAIQVDR